MASVNSGGVEIVYDVMNAGGSGTPVFFLAGLNGMRQACMKQAIPFSKERPVMVHDQRGTGASGKKLGVYSVHNMAKDVIAIMDHEGIAKAHMVGTSTGGAIAQVLCIDHRDRVASAAVCCSWMKCDHYFRRQFEMRKRILLTMGTETLMLQTSTTLNDPKWFTEHYEELLDREKGLLERAGPPEVDAERRGWRRRDAAVPDCRTCGGLGAGNGERRPDHGVVWKFLDRLDRLCRHSRPNRADCAGHSADLTADR